MNKLICLMGKSCTGKDTIYKRLVADEELNLNILVPYTTRPIRKNELSGIEYHFVSEEEYEKFAGEGLILEDRAYNTAHGIWRYFTIRDEQMIASDGNYIYIGTLEAYNKLKEKLGADKVLPVYIEVDDSIRIDRAVRREHKQAEPRFVEMCRRFLADTEDFSDENLEAAGIKDRFKNEDLDECLSEVKAYIVRNTIGHQG
ncbi:MAG: guanylate kinase [Lachnospiraceae bacterium]|nr:guanylate kinase [Lachnospiraceae bacterium]